MVTEKRFSFYFSQKNMISNRLSYLFKGGKTKSVNTIFDKMRVD